MSLGRADILIGIDAGTSVIKSVAFTLGGQQIAMAARPNRYHADGKGAASQSLTETWDDCAATLRDLCAKIDDLPTRVAAIAVTGQGDGTWLVGQGNRAVTDAWLWLDARAAPTVARLRASAADGARFATTGTGLNACQMGTQLAHMETHHRDWLDQAQVALHCKDWLYLQLTGIRATDPSEASFTFGSYLTRRYDDAVIDALGLTHRRGLLPDIVDGGATTHALTPEAAAATGLAEGTPVALGYVDVVCTALGAGIYTPDAPSGCTIIGSTGMHMRATPAQEVTLNAARTGYVMVLPVDDMVAQIQSNMAATLNIDWLLKMGAQLMAEFGQEVTHKEMVARIDGWLAASDAGQILYHPYISEAGERGPFVDSRARAAFTGLATSHGFADLMRAVVEGLGYSARDCYTTMGQMPREVRLTGGAARSSALRRIIGAALGVDLRSSAREEAGAAGAAMMAACAIGVYPDMAACLRDWVVPNLGPVEAPDPALQARYGALFPAYRALRETAAPAWAALAPEGQE